MNLTQLLQGSKHAFFTDHHRIVFWYDALGHFAEPLSELALCGVQVITMAGQSPLGVKLNHGEFGDLLAEVKTAPSGRPSTDFGQAWLNK